MQVFEIYIYTNNDFIFNVQIDNCFLAPQMIFSSPWNQAGPTLISINISLSAASSLSQVFVVKALFTPGVYMHYLVIPSQLINSKYRVDYSQDALKTH